MLSYCIKTLVLLLLVPSRPANLTRTYLKNAFYPPEADKYSMAAFCIDIPADFQPFQSSLISTKSKAETVAKNWGFVYLSNDRGHPKRDHFEDNFIGYQLFWVIRFLSNCLNAVLIFMYHLAWRAHSFLQQTRFHFSFRILRILHAINALRSW